MAKHNVVIETRHFKKDDSGNDKICIEQHCYFEFPEDWGIDKVKQFLISENFTETPPPSPG